MDQVEEVEEVVTNWFADNVDWESFQHAADSDYTGSLLACLAANNYIIIGVDKGISQYNAGWEACHKKYQELLDKIYPSIASRVLSLGEAGEDRAYQVWADIAKKLAGTWKWKTSDDG